MAEHRGSLVWRVARWVLGVPVLVAAVLFAIENRGTLVLSLWPFPTSLPVPIYAALYGALLVGVFLGGLAAWLAAGRRRAQHRQALRDLDRARREAEELRRRVEALEAAQRPSIPPLANDQARRQLAIANS